MSRERINSTPSLTVIIPVYNESAMIPILLTELDQVFSVDSLKLNHISEITYCFVDDGSTDDTLAQCTSFLSKTAKVKIIQLSRNFGHQAAVSAGIANTDTDLVAVIDADLQDPPELIFDMAKKWREGYDVIYGVRANRKENFAKRFLYWLFYRVYKMLSEIDVAVDSGDFCLMDRRVVTEINKLPEAVRFPRGLRTWVGFNQTGIIYNRCKRYAGKTKYNYSRLYKLATDGITSLSTKPLKFAQLLAFMYLIFFVIGAIIAIPYYKEPIWFMMMITLFSNCLILFCLYIIGAYIGRSYLEIKGRPAFIIHSKYEVEPKSPIHD
ncbi:MAG: glycosyltransferase family 2 protein [Fibrobacteria bacterium]|nr:glycosyltransferase family 2 protein [Fibrobacteria bacterium]